MAAMNSIGPIELWALSTSAEDVAIRNRVYLKLGASRGRQMLAAMFPGGSARSEIRRRVLARSEDGGDTRASMVSVIIEEIVEEIVTESKESQKELAHQRVKALT